MIKAITSWVDGLLLVSALMFLAANALGVVSVHGIAGVAVLVAVMFAIAYQVLALAVVDLLQYRLDLQGAGAARQTVAGLIMGFWLIIATPIIITTGAYFMPALLSVADFCPLFLAGMVLLAAHLVAVNIFGVEPAICKHECIDRGNILEGAK